MIVVADSGPLRYLILIRQIEVAARLFQKLLVPDAVAQELTHIKTPEVVRRWMQAPPSWLEIRFPAGKIAGFPDLDEGERQAIALARETSASLLLMDDAEGRAAAASFHLGVLGTIGILERAEKENLLDFATAFRELEETNFHMSGAFRRMIRERHRMNS